ncbi:MAG: PAS domain S-box protein [Fodinibius sp.]|nr:PAS domain S-box protein [Fodinibius sp.]
MSTAGKTGTADQFPFEELMASSSIIFYHCSLQEGYPVLAMSSNVEATLGYSEADFAADSSLWLDRIYEEDRKQVEAAYDNITENEKEVIEFRFRHKQGHTIWLRDEIKLVRDDDGAPESLIGSSIEITEQKQAEKDLQNLNQTLEERIKERTSKLATANRKLKKQIQHRQKAERKLSEQHERMRLLEVAIDNINDMVVVTKAPKDEPTNSEIILVNEAFEKFTGYSTEEVIGLTPTFLHGDETSEQVLKRIDKQIENHETFREEFINYTKDGRAYWVELDMAPFPAIDDDYEYWVGINRDVTKRKEAEQKLEESEQRYRALAELSFDAIFEIGLDGTIINCNKRACELFGYRRDELIGLNSVKLIPEEYRNEGPDMISGFRYPR